MSEGREPTSYDVVVCAQNHMRFVQWMDVQGGVVVLSENTTLHLCGHQ